jgi:hypothetical protein
MCVNAFLDPLQQFRQFGTIERVRRENCAQLVELGRSRTVGDGDHLGLLKWNEPFTANRVPFGKQSPIRYD